MSCYDPRERPGQANRLDLEGNDLDVRDDQPPCQPYPVAGWTAGGTAVGAHPYEYIVKHQSDVNAALKELREREFRAGRYNPVIPFIDFPIGPHSPAPGAQHASIEEAMEDSDADGTRSILDLDHIADTPDFCAAARLDDDVLLRLYGTTTPTREMVEQNMDFFEDIERGQGIYIILDRDGQPDEILFAGYSFD
jgi:hypothetical protein